MNRLSLQLVVAAVLAFTLPLTLPAAMARTSPGQTASQPVSFTPNLAASRPPAIEHVDSFGGIISTFAVSSTLAFLLQGNTLTILDISAPAAPTRIGHMPLLWGATNLVAADGIVYVAAGEFVQIIDARNPALPVELSRFRARDRVGHIQVVGSLAYLNEGSEGLEVVDISDLSLPTWRAQLAPFGCCTSFLVVGNLAYAINTSNTLTILDISNLQAPVTRGTFTLSAPAQTGFWHIVVEGSRAYIGALTNTASGNQPRLITLEISHPENPLLLGNAELPGLLVAVSEHIAYTNSDTQLQLFDAADPAHPIARGTYAATLRQLNGNFVQVIGNRVYLDDDLAAFKILDVSSLDNPTALGTYVTPPGLRYADSIQIAGQAGYLLNRGLQILDLSNPISPILRGYYPADDAVFVKAIGSHAYVSHVFNTVDLLDISNPDLPTRIATLATSSAQAVAEANNRAYILTTDAAGCGKFCTIIHNRLNIFDISTPSAPVLESRTQILDTFLFDTGSIIFKGGLVYIAVSGSLRVIDVATPTAPVILASYTLPASENQMQIVGNLAYVTSSAGLTILDLADPLKPALLGQTASLGYPDSIQVQGNLAFVGSSSGVRLIDIGNPRRPISRAAYADAIGPAAALGDIIYVAGSIAGLHLLRLHTDRFTPPMLVPLARH